MVEPASAILAIVHVALKTSKELAGAISTMRNSNAEVTRAHASLTIHASLLAQFHSTITKANSVGARMAQADSIGSNMANENELIIAEMKALFRDVGFAGSGSTASSWDRLLFRWRWYLYKAKMAALRQELDSIKNAMLLFVSMVKLEEKMQDPGERNSEVCEILEGQIRELRKSLKIQKQEIQRTRQRLHYFERGAAQKLDVGRQMWNLANEQHRRLEPIRRQRRIEQLRPQPTQRDDDGDSGSSSTPQPASSPRPPPPPPPPPPPSDGPVMARTRFGVATPRSLLSSEDIPPLLETNRSPYIREARIPYPPSPSNAKLMSSGETDIVDELPQQSEKQSRWFRDHLRPREAGFEQEQVYHDYGPEDAPRIREFSRKKPRGEGSGKH